MIDFFKASDPVSVIENKQLMELRETVNGTLQGEIK